MAGAVNDAMSKAEALAEATVGALGQVRVISESGQSSALPISRAVEAELMMDASATQIQTGQLAVTAMVTMEFELIK